MKTFTEYVRLASHALADGDDVLAEQCLLLASESQRQADLSKLAMDRFYEEQQR